MSFAKHGAALLWAVLLALPGRAAASGYPPPCLEVSAAHPLFVFECPEPASASALETDEPPALPVSDDGAGRPVATVAPLPVPEPASSPEDAETAAPAGPRADAYGAFLVEAWGQLPPVLQEYSALRVGLEDGDLAARHTQLRALLEAAQEAGIPLFLRLGGPDPAYNYPLDLAEELLRDFTCVKGVAAIGLTFNDYSRFAYADPLGVPPAVRWLDGMIDLAARYGRFTLIELGEVHWLRVMANVNCRPLYDRLAACAPYVIPANQCAGVHTIAQTAALMGLWLEGACGQWGVAADARWYDAAGYLRPGALGVSPDLTRMPPGLYRAMILCGAATGAAVYSFAPGQCLWFSSSTAHWDEALRPTLELLVAREVVARKTFVRDKAKVALQLAPAETPGDFHLNLRDADPVLDQGLFVKAACRLDAPRALPELIPNTARCYWPVFLSPYASAEALEGFGVVAPPGRLAALEAWQGLLDRHYPPARDHEAFVARVGRNVFVLNTCENHRESQTFAIPDLPVPLRGFEASYAPEGVTLTWPFREGDVGYRVYRRTAPYGVFERIADVDERRYVDAAVEPDAEYAYAVTALTNETAPFEGAVDYGEHRVFSGIESRIEEEVSVSALLPYGKSRLPVKPMAPALPENPAAGPYPDCANLTAAAEEHRDTAQALAARLEAWAAAFAREDLDALLDLYASDYQDPQGWGFQYVRRAYQWFFEQYDGCVMQWQVRRWDFERLAGEGQVTVLLYCWCQGVARSGPGGRFADLPAQFPRTPARETWVVFGNAQGPWRIVGTNPPVPNFRDLLSFAAGPHAALAPGPDVYQPPGLGAPFAVPAEH